MKPEFEKYLEQFGIVRGSPLFMKAERLLMRAEFLCPEKADGLFISEFTKADGSRELMSFWLFTPNYVLEGKNFAGATDTLDVTLITKSITYVEIDDKEYDFKAAGEGSRLQISVSMAHLAHVSILGPNVSLRASRKNCDALRDVFLKYIQPNMIGT